MNTTQPTAAALTPHAFRSGDEVAVLNLTAEEGRPFLEGRASIVRPVPGPHRYLVHFNLTPANRYSLRFVHPEYQSDPEAYLAWMVDFWAASFSGQPPAKAVVAPDLEYDILMGGDAVAKYLNLNRRQLYHIVASNRYIPVFRLSGRLCALRSELNVWVRGQLENRTLSGKPNAPVPGQAGMMSRGGQ